MFLEKDCDVFSETSRSFFYSLPGKRRFYVKNYNNPSAPFKPEYCHLEKLSKTKTINRPGSSCLNSSYFKHRLPRQEKLYTYNKSLIMLSEIKMPSRVSFSREPCRSNNPLFRYASAWLLQ